MTRALAGLALAVLGLLAGAPPAAVAGPPTDQLRERVERILAALDAERDPERRRQATRGIAEEIFAIEETARRALGRHWNARTPRQREEFVRLFGELLERSYLSQVGQYRGERVVWTGEAVDGDSAVVRTRIATPQGSEIPVEYRMLRQGDRWRVYDVVIEGVSLVANYRTQFNRIIETASYDELVSRLRSRALQPG